MLVWNPKLYMDASVAKRPGKYRRILEENKLVPHIYCITLPEDGKNSMEIYSSRELWFQYYRQRKMTVIGMAKNEESAKELLLQICRDIYLQKGTVSAFEIQNFFAEDTE